jgi:hypothetical protein
MSSRERTRGLIGFLSFLLSTASAVSAEPRTITGTVPNGGVVVTNHSVITPLARRPVGQVLPASVGAIQELRFAKEFRYVGGQRFILKKSADAEQHFFVAADKDGTTRRLYWIQFERLLPGIGEGYDYSADAAVTVDGVSFRRNARRWEAPPEPGSDRAAMYAFLEKRGYRIPDGALRIRLVHVPESNRREELMVVYAEAPDSGGPAPPAEIDVQRRAVEGLRVVAATR